MRKKHFPRALLKFSMITLGLALTAPSQAQTIPAPAAPLATGKVELVGGWTRELRLPGASRPIAIAHHNAGAQLPNADFRDAIPALPRLETPLVVVYRTNLLVRKPGEYGFALAMAQANRECDVTASFDGKRFFSLARRYFSRTQMDQNGVLTLGSVAATETGAYPLAITFECPRIDVAVGIQRNQAAATLLMRPPGEPLREIQIQEIATEPTTSSGARSLRRTATLAENATSGWMMKPVVFNHQPAHSLTIDGISEIPTSTDPYAVPAGGFDMPRTDPSQPRSRYLPFARVVGNLVLSESGKHLFGVAVQDATGLSYCLTRASFDKRSTNINAPRHQEFPSGQPTDGVTALRNTTMLVGWHEFDVTATRIVEVVIDVVCSNDANAPPNRVIFVHQKPSQSTLSILEASSVAVVR